MLTVVTLDGRFKWFLLLYTILLKFLMTLYDFDNQKKVCQT